MVTKWRTSIDVIKFVRKILVYCENKPIKIATPPCREALQRMGLRYENETFEEGKRRKMTLPSFIPAVPRLIFFLNAFKNNCHNTFLYSFFIAFSMTTAYDVPAEPLIKRLAEKLKNEFKIEAPEWAKWVKTGIHKERPPENPDWWYIRVAAILRKIYMRGPIGTSRLRGFYGGKRDRRNAPYRHVKGSGSIIRKALQQLEKIGLVEQIKGKGRKITPRGQSLVDNTAHELASEIGKLI
ncbi:MAG: 30S ribosomal protein S19e [Candidatus Thermoplasmatota archaeon]